VTQYLIRRVIYDRDWSPEDTVLRVLLFKLFNKIETWELLLKHTGTICSTRFDRRAYTQVLDEARATGNAVYSGAYMMASPARFGYPSKHANHLAMLEEMMETGLTNRVQSASSLAEVYGLLREHPSIGSFLAFQYAIDLNYSAVINFPEMSFVVPGPGARDGIAKCFYDRGGLTETDIIQWVTDRQEQEFEGLGLEFQRLGGRRLQLIDCQNLFCEISKYSRIRHPEYVGISGRTRIKQSFVPRSEPVTLSFPPKWGIRDPHRAIQETR